MDFHVIDTESTYRRLLDAPDATVREAIYRQELIEPFIGLVQYFGGDGLAVFAQWGVNPEQFAKNNRQHMKATIDALAVADAWHRAVQALEKGSLAFAPFADRIPLEKITFGLLIADLSGSPQAGGYTGFGGIPGWIMTVYGAPNEQNLQRVESATVHELHHNVMGSSNPKALDMMHATVGDYMVAEGLAESFSAELYGTDKIGPWVTEFDDSRLEQTRTIFHKGLSVTGFDEMRGYIFGDPAAGLPAFAGYAIGYRVVQAYLMRTGNSVVETTFVPAQTIINDSGFFD